MKPDSEIYSQRTDSKILLLNGPPQSGKDTIANYLHKMEFAKHEKMARPLKQMLPIIFPELEQSKFQWLQNADGTHVVLPQSEHYEAGNYTTRELQIMLSEDMLKPMFGKSIFGRALCSRIFFDSHSRYVISDCGFNEEAAELVKFVGYHNIYLMQIERPGCNFSNDSRGYIDANVSTNKVMTVINDRSVFILLAEVFACLNEWGFSYEP